MLKMNYRRSLLVALGPMFAVLPAASHADEPSFIDCSSLPEPGAPRQWESAIPVSTYCTANAINLNMHCEIPIIGWNGVGPDVSISLYHNSADVFSSLNVSDDLGQGWKMSYAAQLIMVPSLTADGSPGDYIYVEDDGTRHRFRGVPDPYVSGPVGFIPPPYMFSTLTTEGLGTVRITLKDGSSHLFDFMGRLKEIADAEGNKVTISNTLLLGGGGQKTITDATGRQATLTYTPVSRVNRLTSITTEAADGPGTTMGVRTWTLSYVAGKLNKITNPLGNEIVVALDNSGFITQMTDKRDPTASPSEPTNTYTFTYDATYSDRIATVTDPTGGTSLPQSFSAACSNSIITTTYTDRRGAARTFRANGLLPLGALQTFDESNGPIYYMSDPVGGFQSLGYNMQRQVTSFRDELNHVWNYTYDVNGNLLTSIDPLAFIQTWTYDVYNNVTSYTDAGNNTVNYEYNIADQPRLLSKIIEPPALAGESSAETSFTYYTESDHKCYYQDSTPQGIVTVWSNVTCTNSAFCVASPQNLGADSLCGSKLGLVDTITDPNGVVTKMDYDGWGQINKYGEGYNATEGWAVYGIETTYDAGSRLRLSQPMLNGPGSFFRAVVACTIPASGANCSWTATNARENCFCVLPQTTQGCSSNTILTTPAEQPPLPCGLLTLNKPKATTLGNIEYTGLGLLTKNELKIEYQSDITPTPSRKMTYAYDHLNQLSNATIDTNEQKGQGAAPRTFSYNRDYGAGIVEQTGPDGVITRIETDLLGRVNLVRRGASDLEAAYTYEPNGLVKTITYMGTPNVVATYNYEDNNQIQDIHYLSSVVGGSEIDYKLSYAYYNDGLVRAISEFQGNASLRTTLFQYDDRGRLIDEQQIGVLAVPYHFTYEYDLGGNRTKKTDVTNFIEVTYHYDLEDAATYGGINNRLIYFDTDSTFGGSSTPISRTYYIYTNEGNPDRIITELDNPAAGEPRFSATRFGYAANGSAVAYMLGETWNVDGFDDGTLDQCADSYTVTYAREFRYDGARQRYLNRELDPVALQNDNQYNELTAVWSDYVGNNVYSDYSVDRLAQSPDPTFADLAMYQPGIGQVTGLDTAFPDASYYVTNHLGTNVNRFGRDNAIDATPATYSAFGERIDTGTYERYGYAGSWGYQQHNSFEFTDAGGGAIQTPEHPGPSGTHHLAFQFSHVGARYYDPAVGRFMQRDPIGVLGGRNVYAYVENTPNNRIDPSGLSFTSDVNTGGAVGGVVGGAVGGAVGSPGGLAGVGVGTVAGGGAGVTVGMMCGAGYWFGRFLTPVVDWIYGDGATGNGSGNGTGGGSGMGDFPAPPPGQTLG